MPADPRAIDLFLSYNRQDHGAVLEIRRELESRGIRTFIDREDLKAGLSWSQALEQALRSSRAVAIFPGPHEISTWQKREMFFALDLQARAERDNSSLPVIPVLLTWFRPREQMITLFRRFGS